VRIVVSGASGFIGSALVPALRSAGHEVRTLVRRGPRSSDEVFWNPATGELSADDLVDVQAAVHLAGAGVGDRRWSESYKQKILQSRVQGTDLLARTLAALTPRPRVLVSGSAVGFYGDTGDTEYDESGPRGEGFLAEVVEQWEAATRPAEVAGVRVCHARTGVVLDKSGGALAKQLLPFRLGLGGKLGDGQQWQSWITLEDEVRALQVLLDSDLSGPVNLVAPNPVRQAEMTREIGRAVGRPTPWRVPGFALRVPFGGFADEGLLIGQRLRPQKLLDAGFTFRSERLPEGLQTALHEPTARP
jgi:uncharacterized protein (TIGR01777 family)